MANKFQQCEGCGELSSNVRNRFNKLFEMNEKLCKECRGLNPNNDK